MNTILKDDEKLEVEIESQIFATKKIKKIMINSYKFKKDYCIEFINIIKKNNYYKLFDFIRVLKCEQMMQMTNYNLSSFLDDMLKEVLLLERHLSKNIIIK
jgi:hypothetical protein